MKLTEGQKKAYAKLVAKPIYRYGLFNFENIFSVHFRLRDAKAEACSLNHGEPWDETRKLFQIHPVQIRVSK